LDAKAVFAYYGLGVSLIQQQNYAKAITVFQHAVTLNFNHANSYYGLGYAQYQLSNLPAAIAAISKAKQRDPRYAKRYEAFLQQCLQT
jgi:tetratricopeptide (TPR) repeat protein